MNKSVDQARADRGVSSTRLARRQENERRDHAEMRRAELETDRAWAAEREKLRPRARVVLEFAAALAASGTPAERVQLRARSRIDRLGSSSSRAAA